ncbi:hypothetical protein EJ05DRAFT_197812 [Pseudovirgaria hyperparasitica]|uniref:Xylanolytic transcriptional activator regulatory domain-containing protein n=1 Tax=Pseudovirgaria hyperparasitica TaxID=470096 RepID=A0A6A6WJS4_9PEZI|nr:uncharacterized protein EJ05DRAFT_197812 [Pseudovirgaria hyperparasitica]KAF2762117.1 hypothetical protein EJ05DRAFT_197812 [Pseudovirgaria hyperparasitica]
MLTPSSGTGNDKSTILKSTEIRHETTPDTSDDGETEVVDVNPITSSIEFHGNSSSMAFLGRVRQEYSASPDEPVRAGSERPSLVSAFQNTNFGAQNDRIMNWNDGFDERLFSPQLYVFVETYFSNLHYIHPIIDQAHFLRRCDDLWQGHPERQPRSFIAMYFAMLSLGSLIRNWTEERINDMGRFDWSRMLFERAELALGKPGYLNDLEAIHTLFLLAKVCQNELNPNLSYMYLGVAIRTALSIGLNRNALPGRHTADSPEAHYLSRTWWGLYSLEMELSFALGRPDTLGMEDYHNRPKPPVDDSETGILTSMLGLARIMRSTSISIYLSKATIAEKLTRAFEIEADIDAWVQTLPVRIRPNMTPDHKRNALTDPTWAQRQRMVLQIRYYNVKMLLLRPCVVHAAKLAAQSRPLPTGMEEAIAKCTDAAASTIEIIYETCRLHDFFRTWWYNTTYVTFAASILLFIAAQPQLSSSSSSSSHHKPPYLPLIDQSLEILDAMHESVVARKTAGIMRQMVARFRERSTPSSQSPHSQSGSLPVHRVPSAPRYIVQAAPGQQQFVPEPRFDAVFPEAVGNPSFGLGMWDLAGPQGGYGTWDYTNFSNDVYWQGG